MPCCLFFKPVPCSREYCLSVPCSPCPLFSPGEDIQLHLMSSQLPALYTKTPNSTDISNDGVRRGGPPSKMKSMRERRAASTAVFYSLNSGNRTDLPAQSFDFQLNGIPGPKRHWRMACGCNTGGRASGDHIARLQCNRCAQE